jgi:hypothetical protein
MKFTFNYLLRLAHDLHAKLACSSLAASQQFLKRFAHLLASSKSQLKP